MISSPSALPHIAPPVVPLDELSERVRSLRPYQPGKPIEEVKRELGITGEIVKLASNENPLGPSPKALVALADAASRLAQYPDGGCHDLRYAVAQQRGVSPDQLIFGNGSDEIIHLLGLTFLSPGDEVVVGDPTFVLYEAAATLAGATTVKVPLTRPDYRHNLEAMADAFTDRTRLVFVANPHNPTGTIVGKREVDQLLARLPTRALLVLDEAYGEYVYHLPDFPRADEYIAQGAPVIGLRTFSKMYGLAGLRVGYGLASPEIIRALNQPRSPFNVNLAAQAAAVAATSDDEFVQRGLEVNTRGLETLYGVFEKLGLPYIPSHANFVMADTLRPCRAVFDALLRKGVIVRTGDVFGMPTHIRVTVGTPSQIEKFAVALEEILPLIGQTAEDSGGAIRITK